MATGEMRATRIVIWAVILGAAVFFAAGFHYLRVEAQNPSDGTSTTAIRDPVPADAPAGGKPSPYIVAKGQVLRNLYLTGELHAERSTSIYAPRIRRSFGSMVTFLAPEGELIREGERIVEFDDSSLLSQRSEAERALDEARLTIEKTKTDLEAERCDLLNAVAQAEADLEVDELYGKISKDLLPGNTYQQYQLNLEKSKLALEKAKEQLANFEKTYASQMELVEISRSQAEINLKEIDSDIALLKVDAPQGGILIYGDNWASNRKVQAGDNIFPGMEVARLPDLSTMQVIGYVYDTEYSSLARGMRCSFGLDALPGVEIGGSIISLTSVAARKGFASQKKVFQTTIKPDRVDTQIMKPGMTARVKVPTVLAKDVPTVPREYLGVDFQGRYYVIEGSDLETARTQLVEIGSLGDRAVEVVSGISPGDSLLPVQRTVDQ